MCGIGGFISLEPIKLILFKELVNAQIWRGTQGTGIAYINDNNNFMILKEPMHPRQFFERHRETLESTRTTFAIVHHRAPSRGRVAIENTHPFKTCRHNSALIHNGHIFGVDQYKELLLRAGHRIKGDTDSEILCELLCENLDHYNLEIAFKESISTFYRIGAVAVLSLDGNPSPCILLYSDYQPIYFALVRKPLFVFASTPEGIITFLSALEVDPYDESRVKFYRVDGFAKAWLEDDRIYVKGQFSRTHIDESELIYTW